MFPAETKGSGVLDRETGIRQPSLVDNDAIEIGQAIRRVGGKPRVLRDIVKAFRRPHGRPLPVRLPDRNGGFPRLSGCVARDFRCPASLRHALPAESLGKPSLWVIINEIWYKAIPQL